MSNFLNKFLNNFPKMELNSFAKELTSTTAKQKRFERVIYLFIIGFTVGALVLSGVAFLKIAERIIAEQVCPLPAAPTIINNQVTLDPDNVDGVVDCSTLDIIVGSTGEIVIGKNITDNSSVAGDWGVTLKVKNLTVQSGGKINANGKGYIVADGESGGGDGGSGGGSTGGSGGGHGGAGGEGTTDGTNPAPAPGTSYGSSEAPVTLGSAGGNGGDGGVGGTGGGALKVIATETVTVDGEITANGLDGTAGTNSSGGGGAGGSIWIQAATLAGAGT